MKYVVLRAFIIVDVYLGVQSVLRGRGVRARILIILMWLMCCGTTIVLNSVTIHGETQQYSTSSAWKTIMNIKKYIEKNGKNTEF